MPPGCTSPPVTLHSAVWGLRPQLDLHWRGFGDDVVVMEALSSEVMQLDPLAAAVIASLGQGPWRVDELARELAADLQQQVDDEFVDVVTQIVEHFHEQGWLVPIMPS